MRWNKKGYKLYRNFEMQKKKKKKSQRMQK